MLDQERTTGKTLTSRGLFRIGTMLAGALLGFLIGFYTTLAIVVARAQAGEYIFDLHELAEIRVETVTIFIGVVLGGVLGYRIPRRLLRAFLRGLVGLIAGALVGALLGFLIGGTDEAFWAGGIIVSAAALLVVMALALRVFKLSRELSRNDLWAVGAIAVSILFAFIVGLQEPDLVEIPEQEPAPLPDATDVDQVVFIVGDAGATLKNRSPLLEALQHDVEKWSATLARDSAVSVVYAGDIVYPVGVRDRDHPNFPKDSTYLWNQIEILGGPEAQRYSSQGLFTPGNHDWGNTNRALGFDRIQNLSEQLEIARGLNRDVFLVPDNGLPGPLIRDVRDNIRFIFLDTHWFLQARTEDDRAVFLSDLEQAINGAEDRHVIIVSHHPYQSAGPHGAIVPGVRSWGIEYLLRRSGSIVQDLNSPVYEELLAGMQEIFASATHPPLIYAGGHDHSLQVLEKQAETDPAFMLVSGSGSKISSISTLPGMHYGASRQGYMMLTFRKNGAVDLFVVAGEPELLKCLAEAEEARQACMTMGENALDIVYGRTLAAAPDQPALTDTTVVRDAESTQPETPETVADVGADAPSEPLSGSNETAWWTRSVLPADSPIADPEVSEDIDVPAAAVPARILYFEPDSVVTTAGASYLAGPVQRLLLGDLNRHLWDVPVRLPVLNLDSLGGGVTVDELTGGMQTVGIRMTGSNGVTYQFRNIVKIATRALEGEAQKATIGQLLEDQLAAQLPMGAMIVAELLEAVDVFVATPRLVVMPNDERLGEYRPYFAGRVGWIEVRPDERGEDRPGFAGSSNVEGGDDIYEVLRTDPASYVNTQSYVRARLIDFLVGDWDRHSDNWRWARFEDGQGRARWEPIPRDRDWAFTRTDGLASGVAPLVFPRRVGFSAEMPPMDRLAESGYRIDHRILAGVPRESFINEARWVQATLTDSVLAASLSVMPPEYQRIERARLMEELQARRALLVDMAEAFYELLAKTVHVYSYDNLADTVRLENVDDNHIRVRAWTEGRETTPYFDETLDTRLTTALRIYLDPVADTLEVPDNIRVEVERLSPGEDDGVRRAY